MGQCQGKTKKGDQCRRDAKGDTSFCSIHQDQEVRERSPPNSEEWDHDSIMKAAIGFALVGAVFFFRFRR